MSSRPFFVMHRNETRNFVAGFSREMATGETLTGPAVTVWLEAADGSWSEVTSDFMISTPAVNTAIETDSNGVAHPIGQAVTFSLTGSDDLVESDRYRVRVSATNSDTSEVLIAQDAGGNFPGLRVTAHGEA